MNSLLPVLDEGRRRLVTTTSRDGKPDTPPAVPRHWIKPQLGTVTSLDFASDTLAAAGGQVCCVWSTETHTMVRRIVEPVSIRCIALSRDGKYLAIGTGMVVHAYRLDTGGLCFEYLHPAPVCSVHFAAQARLLSSVSIDGRIEVHSLDTGALTMHAMHRSGGSVVFLEPHGRLVVSESPMDLQFIDVNNGQVLRSFSHTEEPDTTEPHGCMGQLLIAYSGTAVRLFDTARSSSACFKVISFDSAVTSVDISEDQTEFLVSTQFGRIDFYDMQYGTWIGAQEAFTTPLWGAKFGHGRGVYAAGGEALVMQIEQGRHIRSYYEAPPIVAATLNPERTTLLVSDRDGGVTSYDLASGRRSNRFAGHSGSVSVVVCSSEYVVSGAYDGTCRLSNWDGTLVARFDLANGPVQALALDPSRLTLWVGTFSGAVACFDLNTRQRIATYDGHKHSVRSLNLSSDRNLLLSCDDNGVLIIRDLRANGQVIKQIHQPDFIYHGLFDADGSILVTSTVGVCRYQLSTERPVAIYAGKDIRWFTPLDDGRLCSLGLEGEVRVFDVNTGECIQRTQLEDLRRHRVVLALGSDRIITGSADSVLRVFDYRLTPVATMHHLRKGVLWTTPSEGSHPGWLFTDRPELLEVGDVQDGQRKLSLPGDGRRERHLAVFNSATHVMQAVNGRPLQDDQSQEMCGRLPRFALGLKQLDYHPIGNSP